MKSIELVAYGLLATITGLVGCAANGASEELPYASAQAPIIGGQEASAYAEAALINTERFYCSGAVIAPRIVLTAGHCSRGANEWLIMLPYAQNQTVTARRKWTEYVPHMGGPYVNPSSSDVGLIILDSPVRLPWYPRIASAAAPAGAKGINVGRVRDGQSSNHHLYFGREVELLPGDQFHYPLGYVTDEIIQPGDSGGPVYVNTSEGRVIVAVNSGAGDGTQVLSRIDLVKEKIEAVVAQNGGWAEANTSYGPTGD